MTPVGGVAVIVSRAARGVSGAAGELRRRVVGRVDYVGRGWWLESKPISPRRLGVSKRRLLVGVMVVRPRLRAFHLGPGCGVRRR